MAKDWQIKEEQYLLHYINKKSITEIATFLNRSIRAIESKAYKLGFRKKTPNDVIKVKAKATKMQPLTLVNCPGTKRNDRIYTIKKSCTQGKRPIRLSPKTIIYVSLQASEDEVEYIIKNYKNKSI